MKNLRNYCVFVRTNRERNIAMDFFKRATHFAVDDISNPEGKYVGLLNNYPGDYRFHHYDTLQRKVMCGLTSCPNETIVQFNDMGCLADTPNRKIALKNAIRKDVINKLL
jgi:hypothetical protein